MSVEPGATIRPVARWVLSDDARSVVLWSLSLASIAAMYISFFPAIGESDLTELTANLPEALVDALGYDRIGTATGYVSATVYSLIGPILVMVFAIMKASRLLAGDEEEGVVELELTAPVSRQTFYLGRVAAVWMMTLAPVVALSTVVVGFVVGLGLDIAVGNVVATGVSLWLLATGLVAVAAAAGGWTGRRGMAVGVGAFVAVMGYLLNAIGPQVDAGWMTAISPMAWFVGGDPLVNGVTVLDLVRPAALTVVATAIGVVGFRRRDLMV